MLELADDWLVLLELEDSEDPEAVLAEDAVLGELLDELPLDAVLFSEDRLLSELEVLAVEDAEDCSLAVLALDNDTLTELAEAVEADGLELEEDPELAVLFVEEGELDTLSVLDEAVCELLDSEAVLGDELLSDVAVLGDEELLLSLLSVLAVDEIELCSLAVLDDAVCELLEAEAVLGDELLAEVAVLGDEELLLAVLPVLAEDEAEVCSLSVLDEAVCELLDSEAVLGDELLSDVAVLGDEELLLAVLAVLADDDTDVCSLSVLEDAVCELDDAEAVLGEDELSDVAVLGDEELLLAVLPVLAEEDTEDCSLAVLAEDKDTLTELADAEDAVGLELDELPLLAVLFSDDCVLPVLDDSLDELGLLDDDDVALLAVEGLDEELVSELVDAEDEEWLDCVVAVDSELLELDTDDAVLELLPELALVLDELLDDTALVAVLADDVVLDKLLSVLDDDAVAEDAETELCDHELADEVSEAELADTELWLLLEAVADDAEAELSVSNRLLSSTLDELTE